ncbi:MATE family efflux transporter [Sphingomonas sp.]|uniref:MATE family efflux transporter n=1 Tax=Sphingomonas sp. TaxID=28214 RepID=UPI001D6EB2C2|nr:MATE family efflux transporter [Sphingomonas sp.]MBX9795788.1 MATE family efflux transporter [Sphingomonas sp.]
MATPSAGGWAQEARATIALAAPLVLTNLGQAAIQATDVVLLGWRGPQSLAAGALGANLYVAFLVLGIGLVTAASPLIARELGARAHSVRDVRRTVRQSLWAATIFCLPVWVVLWHAELLLRWLGQEPALSRDAAQFTRAIMWGLLPAMGYLVLRAFVVALERPVWSLIVALAAVVVNAVLNYGLIFGHFGLPALGVMGAGLGSSITQTLLFLGMALVVTRVRRFRRYRLFGNFWRADWARFAAVWRLGVPIAVTLGLEVTVFNAAVFLMGLFGTAALAAHAIAIQIASLTFMVPLGIAQAATVRVGLAYGRGDPGGIGRAGATALVLGIGFMAAMGLAMLAAPGLFVSLFLARTAETAPVFALAVRYLLVAALFQVVDGAQAVGAGCLRGLQDTTVPMMFAAVGYWVIGIGIGWWLGFHAGWEGLGIWTGLATGLAVVAVLMLARWARRGPLGLMTALPAG